MMITFAGIFGGWEIVLILAVVLILFGAKKLPELAKGLGQGIKEFKKATKEVSEEIHNAVEVDHEPPPRPSYPPQKTLPESGKPETASTVSHSATEPRA